jgi:hypothetical protein
MTSHYRHQRTSNPATPFPSPIEPGEIAVNTANRQIVVGDANAGSLGNPLMLLAVRFFDARAQYAIGDFVINAGVLYRAKVAVSPGAFNATNWAVYLDQSQAVDTAGDTMTGPLVLSGDPTAPLGAATKQYTDAGDAAVTAAFTAADASAVTNANNAYVAKAGSTMTGLLTLSGNPSTNLQAATKQYVDSRPALLISDNAPAGAVDNAMWWESDTGTLYVRYNDGNTTQWVTAFAVPDSSAYALNSTVVRYDTAQSLTAPQQQQGRANIYAAPFDAMAYSGMQINGGMEVSQENGAVSVSVPTGVKYIVDGWNIASSGAHVLSCTQRVDLTLAGLNSGLQLAVTTANPTPAAADYCTLRQFIEGYRIKRLAWGTAAAQPITLGFWLIANRTGLYSGCVRNGAANRGYIFTFNYTTSGAWQYFTVTIPGDTAGTWTADNSIGLAVHFSIMSGSNNQGAAGAWSSTVQLGATGTVNGVAATSDYFIMTGVTVLPGNQAPTAAQSMNVMRPFDQELLMCQRYYEKSYPYAVRPGTATGLGGAAIYYGASVPVTTTVGLGMQFIPKRAAPTLTSYGTTNGTAGTVWDNSQSGPWPATILAINERGGMITAQIASGTTYLLSAHWVADARL